MFSTEYNEVSFYFIFAYASKLKSTVSNIENVYNLLFILVCMYCMYRYRKVSPLSFAFPLPVIINGVCSSSSINKFTWEAEKVCLSMAESVQIRVNYPCQCPASHPRSSSSNGQIVIKVNNTVVTSNAYLFLHVHVWT